MRDFARNFPRLMLLCIIMICLVQSCSYSSGEEEARDVFRQLVEVPGVSFHEELVAEKIKQLLPDNVQPEKDQWGNLIVKLGEGDPEMIFVAHMDEIGLEVARVEEDGRLITRTRGGSFSSIWESKVVKIYTESGVVDGIVEPRISYRQQEPESHSRSDLIVYVGTESKKETDELGIAPGDPIVQIKRATDFGENRIIAGSMDDRAGCAALVLALRRLAGQNLDKTVMFAWVVQEETGLTGSGHIANVYSPKYVFAVDTFVSSDAPRDNQAIGYAPLGKGAVIRVFDSSNIAPAESVEKIKAIAENNGIPVQWGITSGGNDGSVFLKNGTIDIPLSWPGIYSHSYVSVLDIRDLTALRDLIVAVATSL